MKNLKTVTSSFALALYVLNRIASEKGTKIKSVTIDTEKSDLDNGKIVGLATVSNRSRKPFKVNVSARKVNLEFMGTKLAA